MNEIIHINVLGQRYTFQSDVSEAGAVEDILTRKLATIEEQLGLQSGNTNPLVVLALAALHISGDYVELKKEYDDICRTIIGRLSKMIRHIDTELEILDRRQTELQD